MPLHYVYVHRDPAGEVFYVGMGTGQRAWSLDRHEVWHRYVTERLAGRYTVEVVCEGLTFAAAEELEAEMIEEHGSQLVNWINPGREFDYEEIARFHAARDANLREVAGTRSLERSDPEVAIERYRSALETMHTYMAMALERGLVADLRQGRAVGDHDILERLTLTLGRCGRHSELVAAAEAYFQRYPAVLELAAGRRIAARAQKAKAWVSRQSAP